MAKPFQELIDKLSEYRQEQIRKKTQAIADSEWWQAVCKLIGARLINFTYRIGASIQFDNDSKNDLSELDGRIAAYIAKQVETREDLLKLLKRCRKELRVQAKELKAFNKCLN